MRRNIAPALMFSPTIRHAEECSCMRDAAQCSAGLLTEVRAPHSNGASGLGEPAAPSKPILRIESYRRAAVCFWGRSAVHCNWREGSFSTFMQYLINLSTESDQLLRQLCDSD